jgi:hypothetical protein
MDQGAAQDLPKSVNFYLIRQTGRVTDSQLIEIAAAIDYQLRAHVAPAWNLDSEQLACYPALAPLPPDAVPVTLLDGSSATEYGDHTFGPGARIYCGSILGNGGGVTTGEYSISSVTSHECLEAAVDPRACNCDPKGYGFEICDGCQDRGYLISGIMVSDFLLPNWFDDDATAGSPFSFCSSVHGPHQLTAGGYACIQAADGTYSDIFAEKPPPAWRLAIRNRRRTK